MRQLALFEEVNTATKFPTTRYQGSKAKFVEWIWYCIKDLEFDTVLDAFGGTGCVGYKLKQEGKQVDYNDILKFNHIIGKALIENSTEHIGNEELNDILKASPHISYPHFIEDNFSDIYFTDEENRWLDVVSTNIRNIRNEYKRAIAYFALFQACIIKRPYNLFHRKNLYVRIQDVKRSFGNKVTWDTPFEVHFRKFINEANNAVFDNSRNNKSLNCNVFEINKNYDLVYFDPPYISDKGIGIDYADFYHFLEGICDYEHWFDRLDLTSKHKRMLRTDNVWCDPKEIFSAFKNLINQFNKSIIVISYRSDGIPTIQALADLLRDNGRKVRIFQSNNFHYVLSNKMSNEVLVVAQ